jgi:sialate O-acetylesterase
MSHARIDRYLQLVLLALVISPLAIAQADVSLPAVFGSHMVLQRDLPVRVWGNADAGEKVTITFAGQTATATTDANGKWSIKLKAMPVNAKGQAMTIAGKNTVTLDDILVGDVWVCSGQSNMEFSTSSAINAQKEIAAANFPMIRLLKVRKDTSPVPLEDCSATWATCSPETVGGFSAVGYFFGRDLQQLLNIPIGLVGTYWGGTPVETWTSQEALSKATKDFDASIAQMQTFMQDKSGAMADYEAKNKAYQASLQKVSDLQDDAKAALAWADPTRDTTDWKPMQCPGKWEKNGYPNMDGILWYRKTIDVPANWAGKDLVLNTGPIDEVDQAFFNGVRFEGKGNIRTGDVSFWNQPRHYIVPGKLVKAGKNLIAIRVFDTAGDGGLWGGDVADMYATLASGRTDEYISLAGEWLTAAEHTVLSRPRSPFGAGKPGVLFNAMLNPIIGYGIKGAIWYQGEANASRAMQYRTLMPTMIKDWRDRWQQGDFTFLIVSLANYMARKDQPANSSWAELREAQLLTAINDPKTGISMTIDIGEAKDIHPKNKQEVGRRLALQAREIAYGEKLTAQGPTFKSVKFDGSKAVLTFDSIGKGLVIKGDKLTGFEIVDASGQTVWADALIKGNTIIVSAPGITKPVAVRYGWADNPACNLYNKDGLPAVPFRTDVP